MLKCFIFKGLVNYLEQENFKTLVTPTKIYALLKKNSNDFWEREADWKSCLFKFHKIQIRKLKETNI